MVGYAGMAASLLLKRAQVDAISRCAGLSQWFTQDLANPARVILPWFQISSMTRHAFLLFSSIDIESLLSRLAGIACASEVLGSSPKGPHNSCNPLRSMVVQLSGQIEGATARCGL